MEYLQRNWYDLLMLGMAVLAVTGALSYACRTRNWLVGLGIAPSFGWLMLYYLLRALDVEPFEHDVATQQGIVRPAIFFIFLFSALFFFDGRVRGLLSAIISRRSRG